jgi:hypothetical protein
MLEGDHALLVEAALPVCAEYGLALAGGYAIKAHGLVSRPSDDVDFATGHTAPIEEITTALGDAYRQFGFEAHMVHTGGRLGHLNVTLPPGTTYRVDILKEPLNHLPVMMSVGPVIALADVVALKMGALHDRAVLRDIIDIHGASKVFSKADLIAMARAVLDDEFQLEILRDQLARVYMYPEEEFAVYGFSQEQAAEVQRWALEWSSEIGTDIAEAEPWSDPEDSAYDENPDDQRGG